MAQPVVPKARGSEGDLLLGGLDSRHKTVTEWTQRYYNGGDVVPPSTKSQVLRAQKFSVYYFYLVNLGIFVYAFFVPLLEKGPYYGGMHFEDLGATSVHVTIAGIVLTMVFVRFLVMSWSAEFYHFAIMLALLEVAFLSFTIAWWSAGMPVLVLMIASNLLNNTVSQVYWRKQFLEVVQELPLLVPPSPLPCRDSTLSTLKFTDLWSDFRRLWGFDVYKTDSMRYDERCGVFGARDQVAHTQALHCAYMQAIDPKGQWAMWKHDDVHLASDSCFGLFEGWLRAFICNAGFAFAGFWLGQVLFDADAASAPFAIIIAVLALLLFAGSHMWTSKKNDEALGVAVAEKEWLAFDVVQHSAGREELTIDALDRITQNLMDASVVVDARAMAKGKQNLVYMWMNAAATSNFIGESWLSRIFDNVAIQTRLMMEMMTRTDFRYWAEAKWEVILWGSVTKACQTLLLVLSSVLYFGSSVPKSVEMPVPTVAVIGAACFVQSVASLAEALHLAATIMGNKGEDPTHRSGYVSEWAVCITILFLVTNILIWLYMLPIMKRWDIPLGGCKSKFNQMLFPTACGA